MQINGQNVVHKVFGRGTVVAADGQTVTIQFPGQEKKFVYPDAFARFLTLEDSGAQQAVSELVLSRKAAAAGALRERLDAEARQQRLRDLQLTPSSQAVFDLKGPAMDAVFADWTVSTGVYLSGNAKGQPRTPDRMKPNSACLLTTRPTGGAEGDRVVLGAFLVTEDFFGDLCRDGWVPAHEQYRLRLQQPEQPLDRLPRFWDFFPPAEQQQRWGSMAFRYLSEERMQRILLALREEGQGTPNAAAAKELYQAFCRLNRLRALKPEGE